MNKQEHQPDNPDSGLLCLLMMARLHDIAADPHQLQHEFGPEPFSLQTMLLAAKKLGLSARCVRQNPDRLDRVPLPAIAMDRDGKFFLIGKIDRSQSIWRILVQRPGERPAIMLRPDFDQCWSGQMIFMTSKASFAGTMSKFDFTWFIPAVVKYRKALGEVLLISLVLQLIGLCTPLFFQVVMDKVLVNHAMKTLNVIAIGLIAATLFEAILGGIRTALFAHTSSKIDVELGSRLFAHLLSLPITYFQSRRAGDSIARIRELENIRSFLTGNAMTLLLDLVFSFVFLGVMLWYSVTLSLIVLVSIPLYLGLSFVFTPILRARLDDKFNKSAENQAFLVESLTGMDTIKSLAVEPRWQQKWDKQLAAYVSAGLSTANIGLLASGSVSLVSKLVTAAIMWLGATLVIDQQLTVGELVAFNMLAGQVAAPVLRLAQLWNDFQQVGISMKEAHDEGINASRQMEAALQDQRRAGEHSKLLKLVAPVSGTVQQLNTHTVGGVVPAAQPLMQIVPQEAAVEVEAFLDNKDIGFVEVGQDANVKIEAFDYTKYGTVPATVRHVSHDAIEDEKRGLIYASKIVLARDTLTADGRSLQLSPGMSVTVEIRTGTRRVIEYVLSPLIRHQRESLNER
ncbi:hypothetical protein HBDW_35880 [Herbaspirillum sp. DW155]|uniref:HlyD family type I secretion periplasmic adaptor subunit n=2 Tax=Herbaspirillum sp. DW155 TaxID=3095609 RepID=UPI00308AA4F4|nr:hypothetical protein HBDW_35880 [Herbaspirillum sp. DW155]